MPENGLGLLSLTDSTVPRSNVHSVYHAAGTLGSLSAGAREVWGPNQGCGAGRRLCESVRYQLGNKGSGSHGAVTDQSLGFWFDEGDCFML